MGLGQLSDGALFFRAAPARSGGDSSPALVTAGTLARAYLCARALEAVAIRRKDEMPLLVRGPAPLSTQSRKQSPGNGLSWPFLHILSNSSQVSAPASCLPGSVAASILVRASSSHQNLHTASLLLSLISVEPCYQPPFVSRIIFMEFKSALTARYLKPFSGSPSPKWFPRPGLCRSFLFQRLLSSRGVLRTFDTSSHRQPRLPLFLLPAMFPLLQKPTSQSCSQDHSHGTFSPPGKGGFPGPSP